MTQPVTVGTESCIAVTVGRDRLLFARGPVHGGKALAERAKTLLADLDPQVHALRWCQQIHGGISVAIDEDARSSLEPLACAGRCDSLMTGCTGVGLMVWTADCAPVILSGGGVIAAIHSGWRGCAADVVPKTLRRFEIEYCVPPRAVSAVIGPTIGACHYEVGEEVVGALETLVPDSKQWLDGRRVELRTFLRCRLEDCGLAPAAISTVGGCTFCDPGLASYRRDGASSGRQFALVYRPTEAVTRSSAP